MSEAPLISVIIPHLNEPENLRRCLLSLDAQRSDGIPFEIIVVDNGSLTSPDFAPSVAANVRLEREPIPGPGPARNHGASVARAGLLAFIDADCVAEPGWIAAMARFMAENPHVDFVGGDIRILPQDPECVSHIEAYESIYSYRTRRYVEREGFAASGNMAVRTDVFRSVGPFKGISMMEDTEWGKRATAQGYVIAYLADARVLTPSCRSFAELARRWDRHVAHEFHEVGGDPISLLAWLLKSAALAASPLGEAARIMLSDRVSGIRQRRLALSCLTRVRLYRAWQMIRLAWHKKDAAVMVDMWNRESQ